MAPQRAERLAGHVGGETDDPAALDPYPLRVGPGQAGQPAAAHRLQHAEHLRLLAAHHFGDTRIVGSGQPGHQLHLTPVELDLHQGGGNLRDAGRAGRVRRLLPTLPAADHAGQQHMVLAAGEPEADLVAQRIGEAIVRHIDQTAQRGAAVANCPIPCNAEGAEAGGSPIDADHGPFPRRIQFSTTTPETAVIARSEATRQSPSRYARDGDCRVASLADKKPGALSASLSPSWPGLSRPSVVALCRHGWPGQAGQPGHDATELVSSWAGRPLPASVRTRNRQRPVGPCRCLRQKASAPSSGRQRTGRTDFSARPASGGVLVWLTSQESRLFHRSIAVQRAHLTLEHIADELRARRGDIADEGGGPLLVVGERVVPEDESPRLAG